MAKTNQEFKGIERIEEIQTSKLCKFDLSSWTEGIIILSLFGDVRGERPRSPHSSPPASKNLSILPIEGTVPLTKILDDANHTADMELDTKIVLTSSMHYIIFHYIELCGQFMSLWCWCVFTNELLAAPVQLKPGVKAIPRWWTGLKERAWA